MTDQQTPGQPRKGPPRKYDVRGLADCIEKAKRREPCRDPPPK